MGSSGFDVTARIDPETGFPTGGSPWNCGTWMDKASGFVPSENMISFRWVNPFKPETGVYPQRRGTVPLLSLLDWLIVSHLL